METMAASMIVMSAIVSGLAVPTCDRRQYQHQGTCCSECPPGSVIEGHCGDATPTKCTPCTIGVTYMDEFNHATACKVVTVCEDEIVKNATLAEDLKCECQVHFFRHGYTTACVACSGCTGDNYMIEACSKTKDTRCGECANLTANSVPCPSHCDPCQQDVPAQDKESSSLLITVAASLCLVVFTVIVILCYCRRKRSSSGPVSTRASCSSGIAMDTVVQYDTCSAGTSSDTSRHVRKLPYDTIIRIASFLNPKVRGKANWVTLAKAMGLSETDILTLKLQDKTECTQALLQVYGAKTNATAYSLHKLLLKIKRKDAADLLLPHLEEESSV